MADVPKSSGVPGSIVAGRRRLAEVISIPSDDFYVTYLPPAQLQARVAALERLTREALDRRIIVGAGRNVTREEIEERAAAVLDGDGSETPRLMRMALAAFQTRIERPMSRTSNRLRP